MATLPGHFADRCQWKDEDRNKASFTLSLQKRLAGSHDPQQAHAGSVLWISGKPRTEDQYNGSFHAIISILRKKRSWKFPFFLFFREGNNVSFATISDKLFDVLSSELPGQGINFMAELFENCTKCNTGWSHLPQWLFPSTCGYMRGFWKGSATGSLKVYLAKEQTPRRNVYTANVCILFGDLSGCSSLKH